MRTRLFLVVALLGASLGAMFQAAPAGAATTSVVVTRGSMTGWADRSGGTGAGSFVAGVGAPAGVGAYQMTTGPGSTTGGESQVISKSSYTGTAIADLTALTYSSFEGSENPNTTVAPFLTIAVDTGNTNSLGQPVNATLSFEPYYSTPAFGGAGPTPQHAIALGQWQGWDALAGKWWSNTTINPVCASTCFVDWAQIKAAIPNAKIISPGISMNAGQGVSGAPWDNFRGLVDNLNIGVGADATTFNFEPTVTASRPGSFAGWSAETPGAPGITFGDGPGSITSPVPLGAGSVSWASVPQPRADLVNTGWNNTRVSAVTALSYNTFISNYGHNLANAPSEVAPYVQIDCSACGNGVTGHLVFEPAYQRAQSGFGTGVSSLVLNRWQHWDARTGLWWFSQNGAPFQLQTLDQWQAQYPAMTVSGIRLGADGRDPWTGFAGAADSLNIRINGAEATFDFDPGVPSITDFNPKSGPAGTSVTITGAHLGATSTVQFNGSGVTPTSVSATAVTATVPVGATTGVITLVNAGGGTLSTTQNFVTGNAGLVTYEQTNPAFTFSPGWSTLSDANESGGSAAINPNSGAFVDVNFTGSTIHWVALRGPNTASGSVSIDGGPATPVDTYSPSYRGQQVVFAADGFTPGSHTMRITYTGKNPAAASTSYLVVDAIETQRFTPVVTSFDPQAGPPGTTVQITGTHLDEATAVLFNGTAASFTVNSPTSITTSVPSGATDGPITVTAVDVSGSSATPFDVQPSPSITLVRHEETDASVFNFASSGGWFRWTDASTGGGQSGGAAELNSASGSFVDVSFGGPAVNWIGLKGPNTAIGAIAIDGVSYGSVDTYAPAYSAQQVLFAKSDLTVANHVMRITYAGKNPAAATTSYLVVDAVDIAPPAAAVASFDPVGGPDSTVVTIAGANFTDVTAVKFNGTPATTFTVNSPTQITATAPVGVSSGLISITNGGFTTTSRSPFTRAAVAMHRFEQTTSAFHFPTNQGWFLWNDTVAGGGESGGSAQLTPTVGNNVDVAVSGDTINWIGLRGPNTAVAAISIDNVSMGTVDTYSPTYSAQQVLFTVTGLAPGQHTVRITYSGKNPAATTTSYLVVDAVEAASTF